MTITQDTKFIKPLISTIQQLRKADSNNDGVTSSTNTNTPSNDLASQLLSSFYEYLAISSLGSNQLILMGGNGKDKRRGSMVPPSHNGIYGGVPLLDIARWIEYLDLVQTIVEDQSLDPRVSIPDIIFETEI